MPGVKGKSGRKPKPRVVKELAGTLRPDRLNPDEPMPVALDKVPACPRHITGEARKQWRRTAKVLVATGVLTAGDLPALEMFCTLYARWRDAQAKLDASNVMLRNADGVFYQNPYLRIADDCLKQMRGYMVEFGITPSSRSRVSVVRKKPAADGIDEYFFGTGRN